jgi:hypothetical protein
MLLEAKSVNKFFKSIYLLKFTRFVLQFNFLHIRKFSRLHLIMIKLNFHTCFNWLNRNSFSFFKKQKILWLSENKIARKTKQHLSPKKWLTKIGW